MLADPDFRATVCDAQGVLRNTVTIEGDGNGMTVVIDQVQAAHGIPSFAKKFVGDEINIVQSEDWTSPEKGNIHVAIPGKPGEITGTALLTQDPDGTTETVNLIDQGQHPARRRQDRGPDRRPAQPRPSAPSTGRRRALEQSSRLADLRSLSPCAGSGSPSAGRTSP